MPRDMAARAPSRGTSPKMQADPAGPIPAAADGRERPASLLTRLRHDILRSGLEPGLPLRQDEIAARYGVSKIPLREALLQLVAEGLVTLQPNRGFTVAGLQPQEAAEILEIRAVLECQAIRVAMPHMTDADIERAAEILDQAERATALDRWSDLNWDFHTALYASARRKRLLDMIRQVSNPTDRYVRILISNANYRGRAEREHRAILSACEMRNAEAAAALLDQHIRETGVLLAEFLTGQQQPAL